jgi:hypothetical protein
MGSSLGESWTAENIDSAVSLISQMAEELAFVVPDRDSGLLAINALTMDLEQLAELDGPTGFVAGVKVLRVWIDAILDGPVSFSADMIEKPQTFCCPDCHKDYERRWALNHREELAPGELKRLLDDDDRQTRMEERKREQAEAYRGSATEPGEYDSQTPRRLSRRGV